MAYRVKIGIGPGCLRHRFHVCGIRCAVIRHTHHNRADQVAACRLEHHALCIGTRPQERDRLLHIGIERQVIPDIVPGEVRFRAVLVHNIPDVNSADGRHGQTLVVQRADLAAVNLPERRKIKLQGCVFIADGGIRADTIAALRGKSITGGEQRIHRAGIGIRPQEFPRAVRALIHIIVARHGNAEFGVQHGLHIEAVVIPARPVCKRLLVRCTLIFDQRAERRCRRRIGDDRVPVIPTDAHLGARDILRLGYAIDGMEHIQTPCGEEQRKRDRKDDQPAPAFEHRLR